MIDRPAFSILHTSARPNDWPAVYDAWINGAARPDDVEYVLVVDPRWGFPSDPYLHLVDLVRGRDTVEVNTGRMCYVDGVNIAAKNATGRILIVVADDQFPCDHWDAEILRGLVQKADPLVWQPLQSGAIDFVARVNTGTPAEKERNITVMPIVSRARYDRLGYVLYPEYESMSSDNDLSEHAQQDNCFLDIETPVFPHRHKWFDAAARGQEFEQWFPTADAAYQRQNRPEAYEIGARVLAERRLNGFGSKLAVVPNPAVPNTGKNIAIVLPGEWFHSSWIAENAIQLCCHLYNRFRNVFPVMPVVSDVYKMRHIAFEYIKALPRAVDYVLWIDDDNILTPAHFEMLLNDLETHPDLAGVVGWCWIHPEARMSCGAFDAKHGAISFDYHKVMEAGADLIPIDWSGFPIVLHRASVIADVGAFPFRPILNDGWTTGMSGEDTSFFERCGEKGLKFVCDRRVKVPHLKYGNPEPDFMMKTPRKGTAMQESGAGVPSISEPLAYDLSAGRTVGMIVKKFRDLVGV